MKRKTVLEMGRIQRSRNSLAGKTFRALTAFSLIVGLAAVSFGIWLYYSSVLRDYRNRTWQMSRTANQFMDKEEALDEAGQVIYTYYIELTEEERDQLRDKHAPLLSRFDEVRDAGFYSLCATLRQIQENNGGRAAFTAFLDPATNRRIFIADSDPTDSFCPPGSWDELEEDSIRDLIDGSSHFLDDYFGAETIPATTINMEPYGYRCMAGTLIGVVEGYPVYVFFDTDMNKAMSTVYRFLWVYIGLLAAITVAALFYFLRRIKRNTVEPINQLAEAAKAYTRDRDDAHRNDQHFARLKVRTGDEIESLCRTMQEMEADLGAYVVNLTRVTAEKERIGTELALATKIQSAMLPSVFPAFPDRPEIDLYASMDPARAVGGDFYDFYLVDEDHLCLTIADVSGKGIPAALFMMITKVILQSCAMLGQSPAEILTKANEAICSKNPEDMFVTVWLGILELSTGRLTAANAGHEYPAIRQPDGTFLLYKDPHGLVVGGMDGVRYKNYELNLTPGAQLFVYTDGVPEATDAKNELFGTERMLEALNRQPDAAPEQLLKNVRGAVDSFVKEAEQFDDLTMLCVEYKGGDNHG
jgi:sigma-B regulation protein RsbU (phosphoserine phosphatase)